MNKAQRFLKDFLTQEVGSTSNEYGSVYMLSALALAIVFVVFQGSLMATVHTIANEFVNKMDSLSVANQGQPRNL